MVKIIGLVVFLVFSALFYMDLSEFVYAVYGLTSISKILPAPIVMTGFWTLVMTSAMGFALVLRNVGTGIGWVIVLLPMSALPFIVLGIPLAAMNTYFVFRSLVNLLVYILFCRWFFELAAKKQESLRLPLLLFPILLGVFYLFGLFHVEAKGRSSIIESTIILTSCVFFFYMIINHLKDEVGVRRLIEIMVLACIVQVVLSSLTVIYYIVIKGRATYRVEGLLRDFELFAEYMALHIPLFIYLIRYPGRILSKRVLKLFLLATIFVLFATATRGAILSLVVGLVYYLFTIRKRVRFSRMVGQSLIWTFAAGAVLATLYQVLPSAAQIVERFTSTEFGSLDTRAVVWSTFWDSFREKPMTGHGMYYNISRHLSFSPHSTYFYYLLTIGIPGALVYITFLGALVMKGVSNTRLSRSQNGYFELAAVTNTMLLIFIIDSIKIEYLRYPNYQLFIWMIFALIVALNEQIRQKVWSRA